MLSFVLIVLTQAAPEMPAGHPNVAPGGPPHLAPSVEELIRKLDSTPDLKTRDKSFEIAASVGNLYYGQGRYKDAAGFFEQAVAKGEPARAMYAEALRANGKKPLPDPQKVCGTAESALEAAVATAKTKQKEPGTVAVCLRPSLEGLANIETQLGHARFLSNDVDGALTAYTHVINTLEDTTEARYARGALLFDSKGDDLVSLATAKADFERVLADSPTPSREKQTKLLLERTTAAITAGGTSKLAPAPPPSHPSKPPAGTPPVLTPEMMAAFQNTPRTPELEQGFVKTIDLAEDHLAHGRFQEALDSYKQVMPYQPDNPRVRAGMAWSLFRLGKPMADRVWSVATQNPDAVSTLGDTLHAKGDTEGAKALWKRLADSVPEYAPKLQGKL